MLLTQLVRDMDRKIERQRDRALKESEPKPVSASEQVELDAIKVLPFTPALQALAPFTPRHTSTSSHL